MPQSNLKQKSSTSHKLFLAGFALVALVGLFSPAGKASAQTYTGPGQCWKNGFIITAIPVIGAITNQTQCESTIPGAGAGGTWQATGQPEPGPPNGPTTPPAPKLDLENAIHTSCATWIGLEGAECVIIRIFYTLFFKLPSLLLVVVAKFFDFLIGFTLYSDLYIKSAFIPEAWAVVRDLSNIFFILILLYIAVKMILGIGGSEAKKMIANVIIMALLINFSMFFTKVVIDTSNILALIFYNKIQVTGPNGQPIPPTQSIVAGQPEKEVAAALVSAFNPNGLISPEMFKPLPVGDIGGTPVTINQVPTSFFLAVIVISGIVFLFAAYTFFIAGLSFMGRLIELWILIIASPFAFMSFSLPLLKGREYIGWDSWLKRLLETAFMAPIFMFFLYLIVLIVKAPIFTKESASADMGFVKRTLLIVIPALIYLTLLLKATEFAKKGSGKFGEMAIKGGSMVAGLAGGLALGAATGGAGLALRGTVGRAGAAVGNSALMKKWEANRWIPGGGALRRGATAIGGASFDARAIKVGGKSLGSYVPVGEAQKGRIAQTRKNQVDKRQKRAKDLEVGEDETLKQKLNTMENDLQQVLNKNVKVIEKFDQDIKDAKEINDPVEIKAAIAAKKAFVNGLTVNTIDNKGNKISTTAKDVKTNIFNQKADIISENRRRKGNYATKTQGGFLTTPIRFVLSGGQYSSKGAREAANKIRMETKIEDKPS